MVIDQTKRAKFEEILRSQNDGWTIEVDHAGQTRIVDCVAFDGARIYAFVGVQADAATGAARWARIDVTDVDVYRYAREKIEAPPIVTGAEAAVEALAAAQIAQ